MGLMGGFLVLTCLDGGIMESSVALTTDKTL